MPSRESGGRTLPSHPLQIQDDHAGSKRIRQVATNAAAGGDSLVKVEAPLFQLGIPTYTTDSLASTAHSVHLKPAFDPAGLPSGDTFRLIPSTDAGVTRVKIND